MFVLLLAEAFSVSLTTCPGYSSFLQFYSIKVRRRYITANPDARPLISLYRAQIVLADQTESVTVTTQRAEEPVSLFSDDITRLLVRWSKDDETALNELVPLFYAELHRLAAHYMRGERPDHTLQATALVHEAYLELRDWRHFAWQNRAQFVGIAAQMMRRILTDYARQHNADKRGGGVHPLSINKAENIAGEETLDLVAIDEALGRMEAQYPVAFRVVELKFYGGLNTKEIAETLGVSTATVERNWRFGKAWLYDRLNSTR